jgi:hypothetical protein
MITTDEINRIKEVNINMMKQHFKDDGKLFPISMVLEPNGKLQCIGTPYESQEQKTYMMNKVKEICKEVKAVAVFIINEAWIRKVTPEQYEQYEKELKRTGKRVSEYGDKQEVAMMLFETKTLSQLITFDIDRTKNELINMTCNPTGGGDFMHTLCNIKTNTN